MTNLEWPSMLQLISTSLLALIAYAVGTIVYNLYFHPLSKYPGPLSLKISKFVGMYYAFDGKQDRFLKSLHEKYGPYVRIGESC